MQFRNIVVTGDASGASQAAQAGMLVMIVDVIDMSTTLEGALDAGARAVFGCSSDHCRAPVKLDPERVAAAACRVARENNSGIIIVGEPRVGTDKDRWSKCQKLVRGIEKEKGIIEAIVPNLGAHTSELTDMRNRVIVAVTDAGGAAYDAAFAENADVITGTIARTLKQKGLQPARSAVNRARQHFRENHTGIAVVAASRNSLEDVLAAQFIANLLLAEE